MEYSEYKQVMDEQKQGKNLEEYQEILEEITDELDNVFRQSNIDDIETDDVIKAIIEAFESANDIKIKIERV